MTDEQFATGGILGSPWVSPFVWEPPRRLPGIVTASTVFLPFEPAAPALPPPAFRRFELKPEPCLPAPQRDLPAARTPVRPDRPQRMQRTRPHHAVGAAQQVQDAAVVVRVRIRRAAHLDQNPRRGSQVIGLDVDEQGGQIHMFMVPRSGDTV